MLDPNYYVPPPARCESLAEMCARTGGTMVMPLRAVATATQVQYSLPSHATAEVREFLGRQAVLENPASFVARFAGGRVFGPGHVLSPDGQAIARDVSLDFGKAPGDHWLLTYKKIRQPKPLPGSIAVVATSLGAGYCHWLLEELPRLLSLGPDLRGAGTLIAHAAEPFSREALGLHGWSGQMIEPARLSHYQCEELIVPSLLGPEGRPTPAVIEAITAFVAPWRSHPAGGPALWGERIYVTREKARRRRMANEAELWPKLEARGFVKLNLEDLTWHEQIAAFRAAKLIVAPHGAGLANLVFCEPGTRVVECFNRSYVNGLFWQLAALKSLDYSPLVAPGVTPLAQETAANREDIEADIDQVLRAIVE